MTVSRARQLQAPLLTIRPPVERHSPLLTFLPFAGGNAWAVGDFEAAVPASAGIAAMQYPGRGPRSSHQPASSVEELASQLAPELASREPVALFGHSFGALVAFELARLLEGTGTPAAVLVASAAPAPGHSRDRTSHLLDDDGMVELLRSRGGTLPELLESPELLEMMIPVIRSDFALGNAYVSTARLQDTPIFAFGGRDDAAVPAEGLWHWADRTERWGGSDLFDGGHFYYRQHPEPVRQRLAAIFELRERNDG
jgi:surfactin synthase thioesterase subunit